MSRAISCSASGGQIVLDCVWNVMAHAQKPDFVYRWNGRVHLNRQGRQFSWLLAAEVCASAVVMLDTSCSEVVWRVLAAHYIRQFALHFPSRASRVPSFFNWTLHTDRRETEGRFTYNVTNAKHCQSCNHLSQFSAWPFPTLRHCRSPMGVKRHSHEESNFTARSLSPFHHSCSHYFFERYLQSQALQLNGSLTRAQTNTEG